MKKLITAFVAAIICILPLVSCSEEQFDFPSPPTLEIIGAENSVVALRAGYSCTYRKQDGSPVSVISDSIHILDCVEALPRLDGSGELRLSFELAPERVSLLAFSSELYGSDRFSEGETVELAEMSFTPKGGDFAYIVSSDWNLDGYSGKSEYYFRVVSSDLSSDSAVGGDGDTGICEVLSVEYTGGSFGGDELSNRIDLFTARDELDIFLADANDRFVEVCEKYDAEFFEKRSLAVINLFEGSGSIRHNFVGFDGESFTVERLIPEIGTDDCAWHSILVELSDADKSLSKITPTLKLVALKAGKNQ